jgi:outer membrane lipoprotein SlyB
MTENRVPGELGAIPEEPAEASVEPVVTEDVIEDGLVAGRPVEDRSFEVVEVATGASLGIAIGAVVAGPIGAAAGGVIGGVAGFVAGETIEHAVGRASETIDAVDDEAAPTA